MRIIYSVWIGFVIIVIALFLFGCTRKVHTEKTQTSSSDTRVVNSDSIIAVNKTLSEAYEELLKTTNSTGVVFESIPCDTAKIAGSVPKPVNKITVSPDGTKTFEGNIKSYKDDATKLQTKIFSQQQTIDSLMRVTKKDTSHHEQSAVVGVRNVKTTSIPIWMWVILIVAGLLWINERFNIVKIPFITKKQII
jgi:response regulator of citrate/malate metabolism